ncbi:MAG: 4-hydroxyacetophenone monooxygenase [Alteromonadaceae bacterium]|nr:4-hydroxyacetophenone monooxygenase [Alteromonadaceae bacterium]|tara:strand:+ start:2199 stop:3818 length:1620 start_codon:yes stop_codon:yes gene_type:complete
MNAPAHVPGQPADVEIAVIGTGFSGLGTAIRLQQEGFNDFVVLERNDKVGGTWYNNRYPGCACDVQSHLYSFSFEPNASWSRMFATQPEIQAYMEGCAERHNLARKIRFQTWVTQARWDEKQGLWRIRTHTGAQVEEFARSRGCHAFELDFGDTGMPAGEEFTARFLISGMGGLSRPAYPNISGLRDFKGEIFHSAAWRDDYRLENKRVAVIGTGASAIQFVPQIAPKVKQMHLFQRTAPWIMPKPDRKTYKFERGLYRLFPWLQRAQRARIYCQLEARALAFVLSPRLLKLAEKMALKHLNKQVANDSLRKQLTPDYRLGCKRILISNDYYPALCRSNVELVTDGIAEVKANSVVDRKGNERTVDAIILGTGFQPQNPIPRGAIFGRGEKDLHETWDGKLETYLGTTVHGYPNMFLLMGPNTGLGHSSMIYMIESQIRYVLDCLKQAKTRNFAHVEVREQVQAKFYDGVQRKSDATIWNSGCNSWYLNDQGKNTALWPGFTWEYRRRTRQFESLEYYCKPASAVQLSTQATETVTQQE